MTSTVQLSKQAITLKGSAQIVSEFFSYGINGILYQRGVYPQDTFKSVQHYGIPLLVSTDENVNKYLATVLGQVESWVAENKAERLVLVLKDIDTNDVLERWEFRVECEKPAETASNKADPVGKKDLKKIQAEIRDVMRQVRLKFLFTHVQ
ncbi:hypothetical protein QYM36_000578 [Artemia franciscana]|uniref:HORMA domain-containing protein n=1 Tax=Artemia franciscana TaxID=6661 RepID=A0AA88IFB1_ARTSF|nr:hypothetical protein QYM36_000578 [Artemia franciscana]